MEQQNPETFNGLTNAELQALAQGDFVKISLGGETLWVQLTYIDALDTLDGSACDAVCIGVVDNTPVTTDAVRLGDQIRFVASNIIQVYI